MLGGNCSLRQPVRQSPKSGSRNAKAPQLELTSGLSLILDRGAGIRTRDLLLPNNAPDSRRPDAMPSVKDLGRLEPSSSPNPHRITLTTTGTRADALRRRLVEARQIFREIVASDTHRG